MKIDENFCWLHYIYWIIRLTEVEVGRFCCFTFFPTLVIAIQIECFCSKHLNFATFERSIETSPFEMSNVNKLSLQNFLVEDGCRHRTRRTILCILFEIEVWMGKRFKKRMLISIKRLLCFFHE